MQRAQTVGSKPTNLQQQQQQPKNNQQTKPSIQTTTTNSKPPAVAPQRSATISHSSTTNSRPSVVPPPIDRTTTKNSVNTESGGLDSDFDLLEDGDESFLVAVMDIAEETATAAVQVQGGGEAVLQGHSSGTLGSNGNLREVGDDSGFVEASFIGRERGQE